MDLASSFPGQIDRSMRLVEADEHFDHIEQGLHSVGEGLGRNVVVGSFGKDLEDNPDAVVVEAGHSEEDKRTVADRPDQPGLEVGHVLRTA